MITTTVILLLMLFIALRVSKRYPRIRQLQWIVRGWLKSLRARLVNIKSSKF